MALSRTEKARRYRVKHKDEITAYWKEYRASHKEQIAQYSKTKYYKDGKEYRNNWRKENPEKYKAMQKRWRNNKSTCRETQQKYRQEHKEQYKRYHRKRMIAAKASNPQKAEQYIEILNNDICCYCGTLVEHIDHIEPVSKGGSSSWYNLTASCRNCNLKKSTKPLLIFLLERSE